MHAMHNNTKMIRKEHNIAHVTYIHDYIINYTYYTAVSTPTLCTDLHSMFVTFTPSRKKNISPSKIIAIDRTKSYEEEKKFI